MSSFDGSVLFRIIYVTSSALNLRYRLHTAHVYAHHIASFAVYTANIRTIPQGDADDNANSCNAKPQTVTDDFFGSRIK